MKRKILTLSLILILIIGLYIPIIQANPTLDIVQTAEADGNFTTLIAALEATDLNTTLKGTGPFTVFAPTDAAFAALDSDVLGWLLANPSALSEVLLYHVVAGSYNSTEVVGLDSIQTLQGGNLTITKCCGVRVNDAKITAVDIECANGIIHVIDEVLIPEIILAVPDSGIATTVVGLGFNPCSTVTLSWGGTVIPTVPIEVRVNRKGMFTAIITGLNQTTPGTHNITATDSRGASASTSFTVTEVTGTQGPQGPPGEQEENYENTETVSDDITVGAEAEDVYTLTAVVFGTLAVAIAALLLAILALSKKK